ncbi:hypothetical protein HZA99_06050 [Candidatus Woesearchaeota archaeon]|nr:hypothetical protein [Candidatus Woesearchaeota archaeon]
MAIVSFTFTKLLAEKKDGRNEKITINNNVSIVNVEEHNLPIGSQKQDSLKISFLFTTQYDPGFGSIELHGNLIYLGDAEQLKEVFANWQKNKKLSADMMKDVLSSVLNKCNIQALIMSRDVQLPPPVPMPRVNVR